MKKYEMARLQKSLFFIQNLRSNLGTGNSSRSISSSSSHYITQFLFNFVQASELTFDDIVKPAPVQRRPLEIIYNPYPTSCSKFCNHPIDRDLRQEYRDVIKKAKEGVVCLK